MKINRINPCISALDDQLDLCVGSSTCRSTPPVLHADEPDPR
ncbi:hypothetical protein [Amycolatopsis sp. DSM 110486]|nr:hypothetical protein [Amycolatopsis sp. DSM 110486]